ncbi:MAG: hypothetical protein GY756_22455, partial [bacterium]|nr:hypothetical protein [bacterium]
SFFLNLTGYEPSSLRPVQYILTVNKLKSLKLSGKARAIVKGLKQYEIRIVQDRQSRIDLSNLTVENLMIMNDGTRNITGNNLIVDTLDLSILNKGSINLKSIKGNFINAVINSSGDIVLDGDADLVDALLLKKGEFMARNLKTNKVNILLKNAGNAYVNTKINIKAKIMGNGNLYYTGSPKAIIYEGNYNKVIEIISEKPALPSVPKIDDKNSEAKNVANHALVKATVNKT